MKTFRIKGSTMTIKASCIKQAIIKLVAGDEEYVYKKHWYTRSNKKSWAEVEMHYGYKCIVEEI